MGETHFRSDVKEKNPGGTIAFTNASINNLFAHGEIYAIDNATPTNVATSNLHYQFLGFDAAGASYNTTPEVSEGHIKIDRKGIYLITVSLSISSDGASAIVTHYDIKKNNGTVDFDNIHAHRRLAGGGLDAGSVSLSGLASLVEDDTVELWLKNDTNADDILISDATVSIVQIRGL